MNYLFKIRLCGRICNKGCSEPLSRVKVRIYSRTDEKRASLATADPKTTFAKLSDAQVKNKDQFLLAEGTTDEKGKIDLQLGDKYDGEAFDVDIQINSAGEGNKKGKAQQLHLTTLAPTWRKREGGLVAAWDYCLPCRIWCLILALLGRWVICGKVVHCKTKKPIGGVKVFAFDRDWLQDDPLGNSITDSNGRFFIEYTEAEFKPGTWVDIELTGGPDLYFHVRHTSGAPLLIEPPSKGREPGRENVGHCFCETLCLDEHVNGHEVYPPPVFTHVGEYNHQTKIESNPGESGLTSADGRAFYRTIRLNGALPKKFEGEAMEYRFDVHELQPDGTQITAWTPIDISKIARTVIGQLLKYAPAYPADPNPIKSAPYTVNGNPGELEANVVDGWIQVPQESSTFGPSGFFQPDGTQINLNTKLLGGWVDVDLTGLVAGNSSTSTGKPLAQNRYFALRMRVRKVGGDSASEQIAGVCQQIAINNTLYDNIRRHPAWMEQNLSNQLGVAMVDIQQLVDGGGCIGIGDKLDVKFTAAHPTMGNVRVYMSGPGGPYNFTLPATVPGERYGVATPDGFVVADLAKCAYIVTLSIQMLLTDGRYVPDNRWDQIAFCKVEASPTP